MKFHTQFFPTVWCHFLPAACWQDLPPSPTVPTSVEDPGSKPAADKLDLGEMTISRPGILKSLKPVSPAEQSDLTKSKRKQRGKGSDDDNDSYADDVEAGLSTKAARKPKARAKATKEPKEKQATKEPKEKTTRKRQCKEANEAMPAKKVKREDSLPKVAKVVKKRKAVATQKLEPKDSQEVDAASPVSTKVKAPRKARKARKARNHAAKTKTTREGFPEERKAGKTKAEVEHDTENLPGKRKRRANNLEEGKAEEWRKEKRPEAKKADGKQKRATKAKEDKLPKSTKTKAKAKENDPDMIKAKQEKKKQLSRKSAAYHRAFKKAKDEGMTEEEARAKAKEVPRLYAPWVPNKVPELN